MLVAALSADVLEVGMQCGVASLFGKGSDYNIAGLPLGRVDKDRDWRPSMWLGGCRRRFSQHFHLRASFCSAVNCHHNTVGQLYTPSHRSARRCLKHPTSTIATGHNVSSSLSRAAYTLDTAASTPFNAIHTLSWLVSIPMGRLART